MEGKDSEGTGSRQTSHFPSWYAVYTMSRHEAKVEKALQQKGVEVFLPRVITSSRSRNRKLLLTLPLFPGYLFVHTTLDTYDYLQILKAPGVVRILGNGRPTPVPEETVGSVRAIVESDQPFYPWRYLEKGKQVRVLEGPLAGTIGVIQGRKEKKRRLIVSVELFQRSVAVELNDNAVECWS
jgi:transcription antitermination factor NusG